jgi:hypothetical protein
MKRLALTGIFVLVAGCGSTGGDVSVLPTVTPSASVNPSSTPTPSEPTASETPITVDALVATLVDELSVRAMPGADQELLGSLGHGEIGLVMGDSVVMDGTPWYPVTGLGLPPGTGCGPPPESEPFGYCGAWRGWIAGADEAGEPALERTDLQVECPAPDIEGVLSVGSIYRLLCYGDEEVTITAYWPELPPDGGLGGACPPPDMGVSWLACQRVNNFFVNEDESDSDSAGLRVSLDPARGIEIPAGGQWLRITGHFDDPAAQRCFEATESVEDPDPLGAVLQCRVEFVATSVSPTSAP